MKDKLLKVKSLYNKFAVRLIIFTILPITLVLIIAGYICTKAISKNTIDLVERQLFEKTTSGSSAFTEDMSGFIKNIDNEACEEMFEKFFKTIADSNNVTTSPYYKNALSSLDKIWQSSDNMLFSFAVSLNNNTLVTSNNSKITQYNYNYKNEAWYNQKAINDRKTYLSKPFIPNIDKVKKCNVCVIVKPIVNSMSDEPLGVVGICFDHEYLKQMMRDNVKDGNGSTMLVSYDGTIIYHTDEAKILNKIDSLVENKTITNLNNKETIKNENFLEFLSNYGTKVLNYSLDKQEFIGKVVSNKSAQWLVFSNISKIEVNKKIAEIVRPIIIVFFISLVLLTVIITMVCNRVVKPVEDMANAVKKINMGDYNIRLESSENNTSELSELALAFNTVIEKAKVLEEKKDSNIIKDFGKSIKKKKRRKKHSRSKKNSKRTSYN